MRVIPMRNPDDLQEVAVAILRNALADPETKEVVESLINHQPANRRQLVYTAFAMGATSALSEMMQGHVIGFSNKEN